MTTTATLLSGTVMNQAAALYNDPSRTVVTYAVQLPYLNQALQELQEYFELNNIPVTDTVTSSPIDVDAGQIAIGFSPTIPVVDTPYLPNDLIEPKVVWERQSGINPYVMMTRVDFLPRWQEGVEINQFIFYTWQSQEIRVLAANQDNQIKLDYIRNLFSTVADATTSLPVVNAASFLEYRVAGLLSRFIGENPSRADQLDGFATLSLDRALGIGTKGRQRINIRHRPFRAAYKRRGGGLV